MDSTTSLYGVFGNPVLHSLSPLMHNHAFSTAGYNGVYLSFQVNDIAAAVAAVRTLGIKGASVTIPHKVTVMNYLDEVDEHAARIGAVNTVVNREGVLYGTNTDSLGALKALSEKTIVNGADVVIIGSGGAARAIGYGVVTTGGRVTIVNRNVRKGEYLARDLGADFLPLSDLNRIDGRILINTTPVGMTPQTDATPVDRKLLEPGLLVMDIVYNPLKTLLLQNAEAMGCQTIDGVAMFV